MPGLKNLHIVGIESFGEALARAEATILACAREMLHDPEFMERAPDRVRHIIAERERMRRLINHRFGSDVLHAYASEGNFLLGAAPV